MLISKKTQRGFSMIEVLVSLLVIGTGLLSLSGLQIASMKGTNNAHSRNVASMLAMELSERMRANPVGVDAGFYENHSELEAAVDCSTKVPQCSSVTYCTPQTIARLDIQEVMCGVKIDAGHSEGGILNQLSAGNLEINCAGGCNQPDVEHEILITWNEQINHKDQQDSVSMKEMRLTVRP